MAMYHSYTDIRHNIRENVSVNREDRVTNQRVKLLNYDNVYYGSFQGQVQSQEAYIKGGEIEGAILSNCVIYDRNGSQVNVSDVGKAVDDLGIVAEGLGKSLDAAKETLDTTFRFVGKFRPDTLSLSSFSDLFCIVDNQLSIDGEIKRGQVFQLSSAPDEQNYIDVDGVRVYDTDYLIAVNDAPVLSVATSDVDVLPIRYDAVERQLEYMHGQIETCNGRVDGIEGQVQDINEALGSNQSAIEGFEARIAVLESKVEALVQQQGG